LNQIQHIAENIPLDSSAAGPEHLAHPVFRSGDHVSERSTEESDGRHASATTTRRAALATLAAPLAAEAAVDADATAKLIARTAEKNAAFMRGDMARWSSLVRIAPDFTLMQPFGGPASHGFDNSPARLAEMARYFRNGKTALEMVQTYSSDGLAVLVMVERQRAEVGGLPEQDWSLRVTEVYRKVGSDWEFVHRHADPLTHRITLGQLSAIARGLPVSE
jgi:ketosteroid isomerase-like protein